MLAILNPRETQKRAFFSFKCSKFQLDRMNSTVSPYEPTENKVWRLRFLLRLCRHNSVQVGQWNSSLPAARRKVSFKLGNNRPGNLVIVAVSVRRRERGCFLRTKIRAASRSNKGTFSANSIHHTVGRSCLFENFMNLKLAWTTKFVQRVTMKCKLYPLEKLDKRPHFEHPRKKFDQATRLEYVKELQADARQMSMWDERTHNHKLISLYWLPESGTWKVWPRVERSVEIEGGL